MTGLRGAAIAVSAAITTAGLAACSSAASDAGSQPESSAASATNAAGRPSPLPTTSAPQPAPACGAGLQAGTGGVVQLFCDGTATLVLDAGATHRTLHGGSCVVAQGQLAVNAGAVVGPGYPAGRAKPDFVGILVEPRTVTVDAFTLTLDGRGGAVQSAQATLSGTSHLRATGSLPGVGPVAVDVDC